MIRVNRCSPEAHAAAVTALTRELEPAGIRIEPSVSGGLYPCFKVVFDRGHILVGFQFYVQALEIDRPGLRANPRLEARDWTTDPLGRSVYFGGPVTRAAERILKKFAAQLEAASPRQVTA